MGKITDEEIEQIRELHKLNEATYQKMVEMNKTLTTLTKSAAWIQLRCSVGGAKAVFELILNKADKR